jgi:predicted phosphoadenosine phosphosulfate sulfurtransferase
MNNSKIVEVIMKECIPEKLANKYKKRFKYKMDRYDYIQEMYLILLEMKEEKLTDLYLKGELPDYFGRICITQLCVHKSAFHNKYMTYENKIVVTDLSVSLTKLFDEEIKPEESFSLDYRDESFYYTYDD